MATVAPILTEEHYQQIVNALAITNQAQLQIDQAKRAGIDMTAQQDLLKQTQDKLLSLKNVYFPGR